MTYEEINKMVESFGLKYAYRRFENYDGLQAPFVVFFYPENNDIFADGENYVKKVELIIELYTAFKDIELETMLEGKLKEYGMTFSKYEEIQEDEHSLGIRYSMEVFINGCE